MKLQFFNGKIKHQGKVTKCFYLFVSIIIYILTDTHIFDNNTIINMIYDFINKKNPFNGRIFLCSLYNNEAEMAFIHIWRLYDYVYKFILVISNKTHSGLPKKFSFQPFESEIKPYMSKIDVINFNNICNSRDYPKDKLSWCLEKSQRDYAKTFIELNYKPTKNDLLIVVDIDEILTREGIEYIIKNPPNIIKFIKGTYYFPYFYHRIVDWDRGYVIRYNKRMKSLSQYRAMKKKDYNLIKFRSNPTKPLITHCSYCFKNIEQYRNKIISFAHTEYNKPPYTTYNWLFKSHYCRETFKDKGYDEPYLGWKHLIPDNDKLKYLIDRSFEYPINKTTFKEKDLKALCNRTYNRTPFE